MIANGTIGNVAGVLQRRGFDLTALAKQVANIALDAEQTLAKFMVNGHTTRTIAPGLSV